MQATRRHRLTFWGTAGLAFVFVWFAGLAFFDLLSFTQASRYAVIELVASSDLWGWIFACIGGILISGMIAGPWRHNAAMSRTSSAAAAFLGVWAFSTLMWGLTTDYPVSLAVFGPAVFSVVGAQVLAVSWRYKD